MASRPQWTCRSFVQSSNRQRSIVNVLKQYIDRAEEIVGERTPDEENYDREVIRLLRRGKNINKAIAKAHQKYPLSVEPDRMKATGKFRRPCDFLLWRDSNRTGVALPGMCPDGHRVGVWRQSIRYPDYYLREVDIRYLTHILRKRDA